MHPLSFPIHRRWHFPCFANNSMTFCPDKRSSLSPLSRKQQTERFQHWSADYNNNKSNDVKTSPSPGVTGAASICTITHAGFETPLNNGEFSRTVLNLQGGHAKLFTFHKYADCIFLCGAPLALRSVCPTREWIFLLSRIFLMNWLNLFTEPVWTSRPRPSGSRVLVKPLLFFEISHIISVL